MSNPLDQLKNEAARWAFGRELTTGACVQCGLEGLTKGHFKNELSWKEYTISSFCQSCQDNFFGPDDDEEE
jgi:uncharacterized CHY-type Zn-finger protein